ncbi:MAG: BFD-like (2Fe-2S) protein [Desulfococcus sp. 4484_241]|nr:MAG: BFD-like (2Fe-2S) protein [Desulfococcus sp. 4484_241]
MKNLVCFCFGYTAEDIKEDFHKNKKSLIMEKILKEKKAGGCRCAEKNPKGR